MSYKWQFSFIPKMIVELWGPDWFFYCCWWQMSKQHTWGKCYCRSWTFLRLLATVKKVKRVGMHAMRFGDSKGAKTHHMQTASESWAACSLAHRTKCSRPDWLTHSYRQKTVDSMVLPHVDCVKAPCSNINNTSDYLEDRVCVSGYGNHTSLLGDIKNALMWFIRPQLINCFWNCHGGLHF